MALLFAAALVATAGHGSARATGSLAGRTYIIEMSSSQMASGLAEYLVPPLAAAVDAAGLVRREGPGAEHVVSIDNAYDVGKWYGRGSKRAWLYTRTVTVGLTPGTGDPWPQGRHRPAFAVTVTLLTPDADRVDELRCLIQRAVRELAARYRPEGRLRVDGASCRRTP